MSTDEVTDETATLTATEVWESSGRPNWVTDEMLTTLSGPSLQAAIDFPRQQLHAYMVKSG